MAVIRPFAAIRPAKKYAAEIAALEEANRRQYNGGMFQWPCPSYTRISDDYGNRMHPILGVEKFHNGIDLAAPYGREMPQVRRERRAGV